MKNKNIFWQLFSVNKSERNLSCGHKSIVLWLTGFSGAGKFTLAHARERRLYERLIADFTGISSPYEPPVNPEMTVDTGTDSLDKCVEQVLHYLQQHQII